MLFVCVVFFCVFLHYKFEGGDPKWNIFPNLYMLLLHKKGEIICSTHLLVVFGSYVKTDALMIVQWIYFNLQESSNCSAKF